MNVIVPLLSKAAQVKAKELITREENDELKLRLQTQAGGCSGLKYALTFSAESFEGDVVQSYDNGILFVIDKMSLPYLAGATVDFVDTIEKQGFSILNPNAAGTCACGDSFR